MRKWLEYKLSGNDRNDISELITLLLENLEYNRDRILHYSLFLEEAVILWQQRLPADTVFALRRAETKQSVILELVAPGIKYDPFEINYDSADENELPKIRDRLLSGIGTELRYFYKSNTNIIRMAFPKKDFEKKLFARNLLLLIVPIMLSLISASIASNVDAVMLSFLDASSMSAVALLASFIGFSQILTFALSSDMLSAMSQFWGKRERKLLSMTSGFTMLSSFLVSLIPFLIAVVFPGAFMHLITDDQMIWEAGVQYLRIIGFTFPVFALTHAMDNLLSVIGLLKTVLRDSFISNGINVLLNFVFIFGVFGFPKMGVKGAALATLVSYAVHLILALIAYKRSCSIKFDLLFFREKLTDPMKNFIRMALVKVLQSLSYTVVMMIVSAAWGHLDPAVVAAVTLANSIYICLVGAFGGFGQATGILIGGYLGQNKFDTAWERSKQAIKICNNVEIAFIALFSLICLSYYIMPTDISQEAMRFFPVFIVSFAVSLLCKGMNDLFISGFLLSGGEIKSLFITDLIVDWGIIVPVALFGLSVMGLSPVVVAVLLNMHEILTFPFRFLSYHKKKWLKNLNTVSNENS